MLSPDSIRSRGKAQRTSRQVPKVVRLAIGAPKPPRLRQLLQMQFTLVHRQLTATSALPHLLTSKMFKCVILDDPSRVLRCLPTTKVIDRTFLVAWLGI